MPVRTALFVPVLFSLLAAGCSSKLAAGAFVSGDADGGADAGSAAATSCVNIDLSTYDRSCKQDSDCVPIVTGQVCEACACPGAEATATAINISGQAGYNAAVLSTSKVPVVCDCYEELGAQCVAGVCTSCSNGSCPRPAGLVGKWQFSGSVPDLITVTWTINSDDSFTYEETVAPLTQPPGGGASGCVTTDTYVGTYAPSVDGTNTVTWSFAGGTRNAVSGCTDPASNSSGSPMTAADIAASRGQGLIPPPVETYVATATTLTLIPAASDVDAGGLGTTTFTAVTP